MENVEDVEDNILGSSSQSGLEDVVTQNPRIISVPLINNQESTPTSYVENNIRRDMVAIFDCGHIRRNADGNEVTKRY